MIPMKWLVAVICLGLTAGSWPVAAEEPPPAEGAVAAESEAVDLRWPVARLAKQVRRDNKLTAVGIAVAHRGEIAGIAVDGLRRSRGGRPVTDADLWHVGSITKSMTATLIARMVEGGELSFDARLPDLLPDISMHRGWEDCTLHHLLTHTAGMPANLPPEIQEIWPDDPAELVAARTEAIGAVLAEPPAAPCGTRFAYSNSGYVLAGHLAELAAGRPYEALLAEKIFGPLGLASAGFGAPKGQTPEDQPMGHLVARFGSRKTAVDPFRSRADNGPILSAAGRAHLNLEHLLAYGQAHLDGELGAGGILETATWKRLHSPNLDGYGYGWVSDEGQDWAHGKVLWHNGSNTMWYALLMLVPGRDAVMAFTTNEGTIRKAEGAFFRCAAILADALPVSQRDRD